jgi:hypothetical protein
MKPRFNVVAILSHIIYSNVRITFSQPPPPPLQIAVSDYNTASQRLTATNCINIITFIEYDDIALYSVLN